MEEYRVHDVSSKERYYAKPSSLSDGSRSLPSQTAQGIHTGATQYSTPDKRAPPISHHSIAATTASKSHQQLSTPSSSKSYSSSKNSAPTSSDLIAHRPLQAAAESHSPPHSVADGREVVGNELQPGDDSVTGIGQMAYEAKPWSRSMEVRSTEVEFMLRKPVESDEDMQYTLAAAEAGLIFMDALEAKAKKLGVLRGTLSRWILPYVCVSNRILFSRVEKSSGLA